MIVATSLTIAGVIKVIITSPVKDFLISLAASGSWDGIKKIVSHFKVNSTEKIIWDIFSDTMSQFYGQIHYEYNEVIVIGCLLDELVQEGENLTSWKFQKCLEKAIYGEFKTLSDREFSLWVSIFANKCAQYPEIFQMYQIEKEISEALFTKRNLLIQRVNSKIRIAIGDEDHSAHLFLPIIENVRMIFQQSWKEEILSLLAKLPPIVDDSQRTESLLNLVYSNEDCEIVLDSLEQIYSLHDNTKITREIDTQIREKLRHPHFNKVWLVIGKTGSGKTYFVNEFLETTLETLDELEGQIIPCIIDISKMVNGKSFESLLSEEFSDFIGVERNSLENTNQVLKEMGAKVCFVLDGISNHFSLQEEWIKIIQGIKTCSKYDRLRWIITIDEYDYYYLESDRSFLDKYCMTWKEIIQHKMEKESLFRNAFSMDQYNDENGIVSLILRDKYGIDEDALQNLSLMGISTPKEAIIFGEIVPKGDMIGFPSTYFEYLRNVTLWKNSELVSKCGDSVDQVLSTIIKYVAANQTDELDEEECDKESVIFLKKVQLVRPEFRRETNIFSLSQGKTMVAYRLNIYPFWAVKLTSTISQDMENAAVLLTRFPKDMQQSLVPSFIFYNYEEHGEDANELTHLFEILDKNSVLIYALFVAHRASTVFSSILYEYLYINMASYVDGPKTCYSVLYFVFNSALKMREKLELLNKIEHYIPQYGFQDIYERTFCNVISSAQSEKKFKKNLRAVAEGQEAVVNHINGKNAAVKYLSMPSVCGKDIEMIIWDIIDYSRSHHLTSQIDINIGKNESFMDYFVRRCIGDYLFSDINAIRTIYQRFEKFFELEKPFGHFVKRNLTCAAGNIFSDMHNQDYNKSYVRLTKEMAESKTGMNRVTAFFLIENSINADNIELHPDLKEILIKLSTDKDLVARFSERIKRLLK
jgi:hypothetical protein